MDNINKLFKTVYIWKIVNYQMIHIGNHIKTK
jgi:hypothetical protein